MALTIATWNINSVRLRQDLVAAFLRAEGPDILCLQETKSPVDKIPFEVFAQADRIDVPGGDREGHWRLRVRWGDT